MSASYCVDNWEADDVELCPFRLDEIKSSLDNATKRVVAANLGIYLRQRPANSRIGDWFDFQKIVYDPKPYLNEPAFASLARGNLRNVFGCSDLLGLPVFIKCFVPDDVDGDPDDFETIGGLEYERDVYSCTVSNFKSPFFIYAYASFKKQINPDDTFEKSLLDDHPKERYFANWNSILPTFAYSVTEYVGGPELGKLCYDLNTDSTTFIKLTLQMLAALNYMQKKEITHNDLRWGNVLVDIEAPAFWLDTIFNDVLTKDLVVSDGTITEDSSVVRIDQDEGLVKIFDWDRAVKPGKPNVLTDGYSMHTNEYKPSYDTVGFLKQWQRCVTDGRGFCPQGHVFRRIFKDCFQGDLLTEYPWILGYPEELYLQTVCRPINNRVVQNERNSENCNQIWPKELDRRLQIAVNRFKKHLVKMLPKTDRFARAERAEIID
jgi:hypothetical protein